MRVLRLLPQLQKELTDLLSVSSFLMDLMGKILYNRNQDNGQGLQIPCSGRKKHREAEYCMDKEKSLQIFTAGVAKAAVTNRAKCWNQEHPELQAEVFSCGSVELARKILKGERCDVFVSADESILTGMMMPEYAGGYIVFAGNKIVVQDMSGKGINSRNWKEKLLEPDISFRNKNPYADPGGYRGVMAMLLADKYEEGLTKKLMEHPGHIGMDPALTEKNMPPYDYLFTYYSMAMASGANFAELPDIMNLSMPEYNKEYAEVSFEVDAENTVRGSDISHCVTIPKTAEHKEAARKFVEGFLSTDFKAYHFLEKREFAGESIL